uniref:t-SNARE coiled-coil homology domain-containing protein n=1 Tax=Hucho hucho TaxID=62062 RepID=A0A4W5RMU5_9TELE
MRWMSPEEDAIPTRPSTLWTWTTCLPIRAATPDRDVKSMLLETQHVRQEIQQIQEDRAQLLDQNYHALNNTLSDDTSDVIRDANRIAADIKARGELEVQRGSTDHMVHIAQKQYTNLSTTFRVGDVQLQRDGAGELFLNVPVLIDEQGAALNNMETNIQKANIEGARVQMDKAKRHDKNNPINKLFCGCFPCYK